MVNVNTINPTQVIPTGNNPQVTEQRAATVPVQENSTLAEQDQFQTYTVQKGDTLWDISAKKLGNPTKWPTIFNLNRNQIQNANLIYPQQILRLPIAQHPPANVTPPVEEVVTPHEPVNVTPPVEEVVTPHEPVNVTPPVEEVVTPHEPVNVTPPVEEIISPNKPGQNPPANQQPVQEQPVQPNPGFPNIVPVRGDGSDTVVAPQPNQPYQPIGGTPAPIQPIGSQPQQPGGMPIESKRGMHQAAGIGSLLGSGLAAGMIYKATSKVPTIIATHYASPLALVTENAVAKVVGTGAGYTRAMGLIGKIGGPKVAAGVAIVGAGIVGAGLAAGAYKLFKN